MVRCDAPLYRETHATFADSCRERWGFDTAHASRLIGSVEVIEVLPIGNSPLPTTEKQTQELSRVPAGQRADVWIGTAHVGGFAAPTSHPVPQGQSQLVPPPRGRIGWLGAPLALDQLRLSIRLLLRSRHLRGVDRLGRQLHFER